MNQSSRDDTLLGVRPSPGPGRGAVSYQSSPDMRRKHSLPGSTVRREGSAISADSPDVAAAKRLLDAAKDQGFRFQRLASGPDGPLRGIRQTPEFLDELYLAGFWKPDSCTAIRRRRYALIVPGGLPVTPRVAGDALSVLHTVVTHWACSS
jgi:hypothetical protein